MWMMSYTPVALMKNVCSSPCLLKQSRQPRSEERSAVSAGTPADTPASPQGMPTSRMHPRLARASQKALRSASLSSLLPGVDVSISSPRCQMEKGVPRWVLSRNRIKGHTTQSFDPGDCSLRRGPYLDNLLDVLPVQGFCAQVVAELIP